MNINSYQQHVEVSKELKMADSFYEVREPYKESFDEIYKKAKDENVTMSSAKDFLNSLSKDELSSLQHYSLLADDINVNALNDEGAYNLLLEHYEKFDFDNDGIISDGIGKRQSMLPVNMPQKEKEVLVQTLNEMDEKDRFLSLMLLNPPRLYQENDGSIGTRINNDLMDYQAIKDRINRILNPLAGEYRSPEINKTFELFDSMFTKNFDEYSNKDLQNKNVQDREASLSKARLLS